MYKQQQKWQQRRQNTLPVIHTLVLQLFSMHCTTAHHTHARTYIDMWVSYCGSRWRAMGAQNCAIATVVFFGTISPSFAIAHCAIVAKQGGKSGDTTGDNGAWCTTHTHTQRHCGILARFACVLRFIAAAATVATKIGAYITWRGVALFKLN